MTNVELHALIEGQRYRFTTKDWTTPENEVIAGETKERVFLGHVVIDEIPFVEVERPDGRKHLIAHETIGVTVIADEFEVES